MIYSNSYFKKINFLNKRKTFTKTLLFKRVEDATLKFVMKLLLEISAVWF